jgi:iron complex outermembrane receptor protein
MGLIISQATRGAADDQAELQALMALLESETDVATRNKMNTDFVPGTVSVMHGDELEKLGVRNGAEALNLIPGLYTNEGNRGNYRIQVRGVGTTLAGSNIKILLDGVPMNSAVTGAADAVLRIPIEQLERIEVIRGPGSAIHGEFALTGVVNIVTRLDNKAGITTGRFGYGQADLMVSGKHEYNTRWQLNLSKLGRDETGRNSGPDNFTAGGFGHAPGAVDDDHQRQMLLASVEHQGYRLSGQLIELQRGDYFGRNALADFYPEQAREQLLGLALAKTWKLSAHNELQLNLSGLHTDFKSSPTLGIPAGIDPPGPRPPITEDLYRIDEHNSRQYRANLQLTSEPGESHRLLWGVEYERLKVTKAAGRRLSPAGTLIVLNESQTSVLAGAGRSIASTYVQDQWRPLEGLEMTIGARYDHYDDWGANLSPRLALLWQPSEAHIFKYQYAEAFRPPTLNETYPGPLSFPGGVSVSNLTAEELATSEFSYIYRRSGQVVRTTLFQTDIDNLIEFFQNPGNPPIYRNRGSIHSRGAELEWGRYFGRNLKLGSNLSYVDTDDSVTSETLVGTANWLANLTLDWDMKPDLNISGRVRYVGQQKGWGDQVSSNQVASLDDYITLDATLTWDNALDARGLQLRLGVQNLLDTSYRMVPNPAQHPQGLTNTERFLWFSAGYRFGAH